MRIVLQHTTSDFEIYKESEQSVKDKVDRINYLLSNFVFDTLFGFFVYFEIQGRCVIILLDSVGTILMSV